MAEFISLNHRCRRSYYRKGRGNRVRLPPQFEEVIEPIPAVPFVVLHTYVDKPRQPNDEVVIHALCAELWVGSEPTRLRRQRGTIALTQPQHTFGLPPKLVKDYARQLLEALYQQYGNGRRNGFERYAREEQHAIAQWLQTALPPVSIVELSRGLEMPSVEVWLGVLFGGFQLEHRGEFYESPIWVKCPDH